MGGEDFSYLANKVPGCFVRVGQARGALGSVSAHNAKYEFNDEILPLGASLWATLVEQELPRPDASTGVTFTSPPSSWPSRRCSRS